MSFNFNCFQVEWYESPISFSYVLVFYPALARGWLVPVRWKSCLHVGLTCCAKALRVTTMSVPGLAQILPYWIWSQVAKGNQSPGEAGGLLL